MLQTPLGGVRKHLQQLSRSEQHLQLSSCAGASPRVLWAQEDCMVVQCVTDTWFGAVEARLNSRIDSQAQFNCQPQL